jgi:type I restriction enzyme, S subunit
MVIPEGWQATTVDSLGNFINGNGFKNSDWSEEGLPIIRIQNLNGSRAFNYFNGVPKKQWLVQSGDLLFAWAGVPGVSFGPALWQGRTGVLNQHIYRIVAKKHVDTTFLFLILRLVTSRIESKAHGFKSSLLHVRKEDITDQEIGLPRSRSKSKLLKS